MSEYHYSIFRDTPNNKVNASFLDQQIRQSDITVALAGINVVGDTISVVFKAAISAAEKTILDGLIAAHDGKEVFNPPAPVTANNKPRIQIDPREGTGAQHISLNWCDKTTWFAGAVKKENVILSSSILNPTTFTFPDQYLIDVTHGRITEEHLLEAEYAPKIYVSGTLKTEQEFAYDADVVSSAGTAMTKGDYIINYESGSITFFEAPSEAPVATYYCAKESCWFVTPGVDKKMHLIAVETQLSDDAIQNDTVVFQYQITYKGLYLKGALSGSMLQSNGGPLPDDEYTDPPNAARFYKRIDDFINESQRSYPVMPMFGGDPSTNPRATKTTQHVFRWPYNEEAARFLSHAEGTRIKVYLKYDQPFSGTKAVCTFYTYEEAE